MEMNGGFLVTKIKTTWRLDFEKILSEKNIDAFNDFWGAFSLCAVAGGWYLNQITSTKCGLAIHLLRRCWKEWKIIH